MPTPTTGDDLVTTREALDILGRSDPSTIARYVQRGTLLPAFKAPGKRGAYVFHRATVEALRDRLDTDEVAS